MLPSGSRLEVQQPTGLICDKNKHLTSLFLSSEVGIEDAINPAATNSITILENIKLISFTLEKSLCCFSVCTAAFQSSGTNRCSK